MARASSPQVMRSTMRDAAASIRRQRGTERGTTPLSSLHARPSLRKLVWSRLAIWVTVALWVLYIVTALLAIANGGAFSDTWELVATVVYLFVVTVLTYSALMYLIARAGAFERFGRHARTPRAELDRYFAVHEPELTLLVPSYAEEPALVRKTLWSAVLQEHPGLRVTLLIDDAPDSTNDVEIARLEQTRGLVDEITRALEPCRRWIEDAGSELHAIGASGAQPERSMAIVAAAYREASGWLSAMRGTETRVDHIDAFFGDSVLGSLGADLAATAEAIERAASESALLSSERIWELLSRLDRIFSVRLTSFERKQYVSLPHDPNKAMNLNAYISLIGGSYRDVVTDAGRELVPTEAGEHADLVIAPTDYVLTLDADSMLLPEYCARLVFELEKPTNARVAVIQTPYSSFRGAPTRIERFASATTDVQHIVHQGLARWGAVFWVGANAVIRMRALEDVVTVERVNGREVLRYVQDRTVIEDTESSIDLVAHGWSLLNYPERLSYSTTPKDFGSLVVQRRRWANGGLLILPKLWRLQGARRREGRPMSFAEVALRNNYLASISWASLGMVVLMISYPFNGRLVNPLLALLAVPYFIAMASDLRYAGYRRVDIAGVYGLNLLLLPVNIAGVLGSLRQAVTGARSRFARTPKVANRTVAPFIYVVAPYVILVFSLWVVWRSVQIEAWGTLAFSSLNALCAAWAIGRLVGIRASIADAWIGWVDWLWVRVPAPAAQSPVILRPDWRVALDDGVLEPALPSGRTRRKRRRTASTYSGIEVAS